ncbi:MAG: hypothetical protein JNK04_03630 [Myxococcales bacterium]|nr:hypothetical protein [Myxococcales bacterium]
MLKISGCASPESAEAWVLEGRLVGPWTDELSRITSERCPRELDLAAVTFADRAGLTLLRQLARRGVTLSRPSPFLAAMLAWDDPPSTS